MTHSEFWQLTLAEFLVKYEEYIKAERNKLNEFITLAWLTANYTRAKTFPPDLNKLLIKEGAERKVQTVEEMMAMAKIVNAAWGGEEIKT